LTQNAPVNPFPKNGNDLQNIKSILALAYATFNSQSYDRELQRQRCKNLQRNYITA
jgi:hypothetical protein